MSGNPDRQHHIPKMLLKYFEDETGRLWMFDDRNHSMKYQTRDKVGFVKHLYTIEDENGNKDYSLERAFGRVESDSEVVIQNITTSYNIDSLVQNSLLIIRFVSMLMLRSPKLVRLTESADLLAEVIEIFEAMITSGEADEADVRRYIHDISKKKGLSYAVSFEYLWKDRIDKLIKNFDVEILYHMGTGNFVVGDSYFAGIMEEGGPYSTKEWWKSNISIYCPLASKCCLRFFPKEIAGRVDTRTIDFGIRGIDIHELRKINRIVVSQYQRYLYSETAEDIHCALMSWPT